MMSSEPHRPANSSATPSRAAVLSYVREVIAGVTDTTTAALTSPDALRDLRMDSLTRMNVTLAFERDLGEMPATLMFQNQTVEDLADHFLATRPTPLSDVVANSEPTRCPAAPRAAHQAAPPSATPDHRSRDSEDIAVVAVTGRYPGAPDIESLWRNLRDGVTAITEVPADRWDWREYFDPRRGQPNMSYGRWGGFIDGVADFDAEFFGILPSEAANIDPQERLFLHACWNLLEQAGHLGLSTHQPDTGVFVGTMNSTYGKMGAAEWPLGKLTGANSAAWSIANRVSYVFDFHGPSFAVDSACSSSLVAVHLACESLRSGECAAAIAGGVNLILHPSHLVGLSATGMLASGKACRVFDAAADGYVPGEGVGAVLLKPLAAALADNDHVWGVIKAGALNTAGRTSGFTVPNPTIQSDLVTTAIRRAGITPGDISYFEAHGTGTKLGDPIETAGLARSLEPGRPDAQTCAVGSVKANIGHLEGAAGIAGLTKVLLQLKHRHIPPCVGLDTLNPQISSTSSVLHFPRFLTPWHGPEGEADGHPLRAGVSSFGAGGANAHLIVEEFVPLHPVAGTPAEHDAAGGSAEHVVLLSTRTVEQLRALAAEVAGNLPDTPEAGDFPERLAYSTQIGRKEMAERLAVPFTGLAQLRTALEDFIAGKQTAAVMTGSVLGGNSRRLQPYDEDDQAYVDALTHKHRADKLARLWVDGAPVDWSRLWTGRRPYRVNLPSYPFAMRRFWSPAAPTATALSATSGSVSAPPVSASAFLAYGIPVDSSDPAANPDQRATVEGDLRLAACGFLLVDPSEVDIDADLMELGFDSLTLVQLIDLIEETYDIALEAVVVFDHPTLRAIVDHLLHEHTAAVAERHRRGAGPQGGEE
ncbi:beta-ketoacyl synthase N-terminal-like domain-containing protein [Streptomyces sp. NPDC056987]|uniref:beta-ketoacyl synthase N-terminal-like domain-containing protein n=1 Tax=Streptomyces sp. NPDC056987 TaxID=3345988 RepID=UPI00363CFEB0